MNPLALSSTPLGTDRWGIAAASDRRFRQLLTQVSVPLLCLLGMAPFLPFEPSLPAEVVPTRHYLEVLTPPEPVADKPPAQPPVQRQARPVVTPPPEKGAVIKSEPRTRARTDSESRRAAARAEAERAGIAAIRAQLASLDGPDDAVLNSDTVLENVKRIAEPARGDLAGSARHSSSGSGEAGARTASATQGRTDLGSHQTAPVAAAITTEGSVKQDQPQAGGSVSARTLEEIQLTFDRSKGAFYAIFNRAARSDARIKAGNIVISLTIAPDGTVTNCHIVASSFHNQELHQKLLQRVKLLKFKAREVPEFTYPNYPINYLPS